MRRIYRLLLIFFLVISVTSCDFSDDKDDLEGTLFGGSAESQILVMVDDGDDGHAISPYIYGSNQTLSNQDVWTVRRLGGNRLTGYNWENDYSNAGSDYLHSSDTFLLDDYGVANGDAPARVMTHFHDQSLAMGAESMLSLQLAGYVSADQMGTVSEAQTAPSSRWNAVVLKKDAPFADLPDLTDGVVYMDELVHYLVNRYGSAASTQGVKWYSLDNEPALWAHTHPRIHPEPLGAAELVDRSIELALAVKAVDPDAQIVGPALYGFAAFESLQEAPDWAQERTGRWFIDYYLDRMRAAELEHGIRLLDVLDIHWYPEARGDNRIVFDGTSTEKDNSARLQAPRTLWDDTYVEDSWIGQWKQDFLPLLPALQSSIDAYYPGTKLGITEYNYGAGNAITGGLAQADVLGIFGREQVDIATLWKLQESNAYITAAFNLYQNYDGNRSTFGDVSVPVQVGDDEAVSVYASKGSGQLHIIAINKHQMSYELMFELSEGGYRQAKGWYFDESNATIRPAGSLTLVDAKAFNFVVPPLTAVHLVLENS